MKDIYVTLAGVVASDPRAVVLDGSLPVTSFRLASTSRRYDRGARDWVDAHTTWVTVTCWRRLARNVAESIVKKDRVVVYGKLRTPEWAGENGVRRSGVEVEAEALGPDLTFGTTRFTRVRSVEALEVPGRRAADQLVREIEMEAMAADLASLLEPPDDEPLDEHDLEDDDFGDEEVLSGSALESAR